MPQMMPIYWMIMFMIVNLFIYFFCCSYYFNYLLFSSLKFKKFMVGLKGLSYIK